MSENVYVVEIRPPGSGDDEWMVAYYAQDERAPDTLAMAVFGNARDAERAKATFAMPPTPGLWEARIRVGRLTVTGRAVRAA